MLSRELQCIFVHIPKTAGQSIERAFLEYFGLRWEERSELLLMANKNPERGPPRLAHLKATEYARFGYVSEAEFFQMRKFAFVRNPWSRLVSEYRFRAQGEGKSFREWVLHGLPKESRTDAFRHIMPQADYILDDRGEWAVDFIGYYETLQSDYDKLRRWINVELPDLSWTNKSRRRSGLDLFRLHGAREMMRLMKGQVARAVSGGPSLEWQHYYDRDTLRFVRDYYGKDIDVLGYTEPE